MEQSAFCNPVPFSDGNRHTNPDPFVLRWCGLYYCYATDEAGVKVSVSEDLVQWQDKGYAILTGSELAYLTDWLSLCGSGSCTVLSDGMIRAHISWETEDIQLCRICRGNHWQLFANGKPIRAEDGGNHAELLIENACLHQYSFCSE